MGCSRLVRRHLWYQTPRLIHEADTVTMVEVTLIVTTGYTRRGRTLLRWGAEDRRNLDADATIYVSRTEIWAGWLQGRYAVPS